MHRLNYKGKMSILASLTIGIYRMIRLLLKPCTSCFLMLILIFLTISAQAQVAVERSKDKVVIEGETWYIHMVKKGETYYSISRAYGISTEQLSKENPSAGATLKEGQSLRIPVKIVSSVPPAKTPAATEMVHDDTRFIYHKLNHGETIYFLSKTYDVSEQEIIRSNPGIDITRLPLGSEIAIPRKNIAEIRHSTNANTNSNTAQEYYHKVAGGETLSSIARHYGISLREIKRANRGIRFPQVGDYVRIPGFSQEVQKPVETEIIDTLPDVTEAPVVVYEKPSEHTQISNLNGSFDLAVLLPFYLWENARYYDTDSAKTAKGRTESRRVTRPEGWIYPASLEFVEMYEGILMAADTLRTLGLDVNIHAFDIKSDTVEIIRLLNSGSLDKMDLIIGPVYSKNLSLVASYAGKLEIPVVSPVPLFSNSVLYNNPFLFLAGSSLEVAQKAIARKSGEYSDHNFILIHSPQDTPEEDVGRFKSMIYDELISRISEDRIKIKDINFYSRSEYGRDSVNKLSHALSENTGNVVIIASEDAPVMSEMVMEVRNLSRKFDIKVFGYPEMRNLSNIDPKFFFDLGLMVYTPLWIDYSSEDVGAFISDFRNKFYTEPSGQSYAWQGYDIAYYFLSGMAMHGKEFILHPEIHYPDLLHTDFDFRRKSINDGFENQKLYLIRYTNNYDLSLIKETTPSGSYNNY